jgi:GTP pyrophosphokinase
MDRIADEGIAAHWTYKEGHLALAPEEVIQITKIRDLFDAAGEAEDATDFMEAVKVEFYADEVFVFTPKGDVKRFPQGSTTLDFAYAIHTDVGNRCTGAKVNGRMVPLRYELHSGDTVEILTSEQQRPTRDWLDIARTGRAIQKIRRVLHQEEREHGVKLGREMVEAELQRFGWNLARVMKEGRGAKLMKERGIKELDALLVEVARGHQPLVALVRDVLPEGVYQTRQVEAQQSALQSLLSRFRRTTTSPVLITGEDGVLVSYAKCCGPLPGEVIVGFITRGRGITVHRASCPQLADLDPERRIPVEWDASNQTRHAGEIHVYCTDRPGMLASITKICEQNGVNIDRAEAKTAGEHPAVVTLQLSLRDVNELTRLIKNIEKVPGVETVQRSAG